MTQDNENIQNDLPETDELLRELNELLREAGDTPQSEPEDSGTPQQEPKAPVRRAAPVRRPAPLRKPASAPKKAAKEKTPRQKRISKIIYYGLICLFAAVFLGSGIYLLSYFLQSKQQGSDYDDLAARVESIRKEQAEQGGNSTGGNTSDSDPSGYDGPYADILPEYRDAYALNNDLVGWIKIEGTNIDYPVMQTPGNKDYYLKHNFNKERSNWGCVYVRESCDVFTPSDNVTIYGHYMQDGSMFHDLHGYYYSSFYKEHPYIQFDTIYERHTYQIIAVFKTSANIGEGFAYHLFDYAQDKAEFDEYIDTVKSLRFYWTGVEAEYGDMLITLSTCEYTLDNGRLVVVAKRIS